MILEMGVFGCREMRNEILIRVCGIIHIARARIKITISSAQWLTTWLYHRSARQTSLNHDARLGGSDGGSGDEKEPS